MYKIPFLLFSAAMLLFSACDPECRKIIEYKFEIPMTLTPAQDTFSIGDTIWIHSSFSEEMLDLNSGKIYPLEDFDFHTEYTFSQIDTSPFGYANVHFEIILLKGEASLVSSSNSSSFIATKYSYQNNRYVIKLGFIPQKSGLFNFATESAIVFFNLEYEIDLSPCGKEYWELIYKMNDSGGDNNYEYIALSPDSLIRTITKENFDEHAGYNFYVVE